MNRRARGHAAGAVATLVAFALFAYLVARTGPGEIVANVRELGWGFVVLIAISAARQVFRAAAWALCIEPERRTVPFLELMLIRLAGEAVTTLTFAGPLLGETAKAVVVSRRMPAADGVPSIVVENIVYTLSVAVVILAGTAVLLFGFALPDGVRIAAAVAAALSIVAVVAGRHALSRRWSPVGRLVDRGSRFDRLSRVLAGREARIRHAEHAVHEFFVARRPAFVAVLAFELLASLPGIVEAYVILRMTTGTGSWAAALVLESVYRIVNTIFSFIPLRVGVDEGGAALVLAAIGVGAAEGVSLAIIRKIRTLFWVAVGLAVLAWYSIADRERHAA